MQVVQFGIFDQKPFMKHVNIEENISKTDKAAQDVKGHR